MNEQENIEVAQFGVDGDWSYLRAHLDHPRHTLAQRLSSGLASWILSNWHTAASRPSRLAMIARIPLGPRQSLALVEAEGTRLLVATSGDTAASFFPLNQAVSSMPLRPEDASDPILAAVAKKYFQLQPERAAALPAASLSGHRLPSPPASLSNRLARRSGIAGRVSW